MSPTTEGITTHPCKIWNRGFMQLPSQSGYLFVLSIYLLINEVASFLGSSALEREIELVCAERAWYFFSREHCQRQNGGKTTLIACGRTQRLRTGKRAKVAGNLLLVSSYRGANIIHTERWTQITRKMLPLCSKNSGPNLVTSWSREKIYQALHACTIRIPGEPGNEASSCGSTRLWPRSQVATFRQGLGM